MARRHIAVPDSLTSQLLAALKPLIDQGGPVVIIPAEYLGKTGYELPAELDADKALLALASGAKTVKMKFGHHGGNHPVKDIDNNTVMITAQNHGFAVDEASMPANLRVTHKSLFDGTLQGIHRTDKPAFSFQGHPEAFNRSRVPIQNGRSAGI